MAVIHELYRTSAGAEVEADMRQALCAEVSVVCWEVIESEWNRANAPAPKPTPTSATELKRVAGAAVGVAQTAAIQVCVCLRLRLFR
jgi:hypothetical protein